MTLYYNDKVEGGMTHDFTAIEIHDHNSRNRFHNHCGTASFHRTAKPFQVRGGAGKGCLLVLFFFLFSALIFKSVKSRHYIIHGEIGRIELIVNKYE